MQIASTKGWPYKSECVYVPGAKDGNWCKSYTKQRRTSVLQAGSFATAMEPQPAEYGQMASVRLGHARASLAMSGLNASSLVSGRATVQVFLSSTALALAMRPLTRWHGLTMLPRACSPAKDRAA